MTTNDNSSKGRYAIMAVIAGGFLLLAVYYFFGSIREMEAYRRSVAGWFFDPPINKQSLKAMLFLGLGLGMWLQSLSQRGT